MQITWGSGMESSGHTVNELSDIHNGNLCVIMGYKAKHN